MAKLTWLGEPGGPDETEWKGQTFRRGEAVTVDDEHMIAKAKTNRHFQVGGSRKAADDVVDPDAPIRNPMGRPEDHPENAAFAPQEQLTARRETSETMQERDEEEAKRGPGRPRKV